MKVNLKEIRTMNNILLNIIPPAITSVSKRIIIYLSECLSINNIEITYLFRVR